MESSSRYDMNFVVSSFESLTKVRIQRITVILVQITAPKGFPTNARNKEQTNLPQCTTVLIRQFTAMFNLPASNASVLIQLRKTNY